MLWVLFAAIVTASTRPGSVCPLSRPEYFTLAPSASSHGSITLHNPDKVDNAVLAVVTRIGSRANHTSSSTLDKFPLIIPGGGNALLDLTVYDPTTTISVDFRLIPHHSCAETYWSERRDEPNAMSYVSSVSGLGPEWGRWNQTLWARLRTQFPDILDTNGDGSVTMRPMDDETTRLVQCVRDLIVADKMIKTRSP